MIKIYPYKMGSRGATALARSLKAKKVYPDRNYRPRNNHLIVNWGSSIIPQFLPPVFGGQVLNHFGCVATASNKLYALRALTEEGIPVPDFTIDRVLAQQWVDDNQVVVERHKLQGHSGDGIAIKEFGSDIAPAPLYTKYIKKSAEYRVHIFNGEVIDVQQKRKRQETPNEEVDYQVRNHQNGWVYCREDIVEPEGMAGIAIAAVAALNLDFGAVDIIYNEHRNQCYVLEINTACGLEGTTLARYTDAIQHYAEERGY